jgi:hypothetical protein
MSKLLKTGGEVDSYCTKCRMVLNHRIVAMVSTTPVRVECLTCDSQHNYRPRMPGERAERAGSTRGGPKSTGPRGETKAELKERERVQSWEKSIAGKAMSDFVPYRVSQVFTEGQLVRHSKFGDGIVTRIIDSRKVEVLFKDDARTLAQGLTD